MSQDKPRWRVQARVQKEAINSGQLRGARVLIRMSQRELAKLCKVSVSSVQTFENGWTGGDRVSKDVRERVRRVLEYKGIIFADYNSCWVRIGKEHRKI